MKRVTGRIWLICGLGLVALGARRAEAVDCSGVAAFRSCTAYASGAKVTYNGNLYHSIAPISSTRDCPPNSPYDPSNDNWWTNDGACSSSATATATKTATATSTTARATATPTSTSTATATTGGATATSTRTSTATATKTATATQTSSGTGNCAGVSAFQSCTAYASGAKVVFNNTLYHSLASIPSNRDCPPSSPYDPSNDNWWTNDGACSGGSSTATATATATKSPTATATSNGTATNTSTATATPTSGGGGGGGNNVGGYFAQWGIYSRAYYVKNIETSGSAAKTNIIHYAFNNVVNNRCSVGVSQSGVGDAFADYGKSFGADISVDGNADTWDQALKGNWNQLKKLKAKHPGLKVVISLGGWTWSDGFYTAAQSGNRSSFVASCVDAYIKGNLPIDSNDNAGGTGAAAGLFDGIDLDWEYPGVCGNNPSCGASAGDKANLTGLVQEFRNQLNSAGSGFLLTAAVAAGSDKTPNYDMPALSQNLDYIDIMTYDFFGAWAANGPTAFHSPLYAWTGMPTANAQKDYYTDKAVQLWKTGGAPASKLKVGVGFYGRGWTGVPSTNNGVNQSATGAASGTYEAGIEDYKVLVTKGGFTSRTDSEAQTQYIYNGSDWWSYDVPSTISTKMSYAKNQGLGGAFIWSYDGDDASGTLMTAVRNGLP